MDHRSNVVHRAVLAGQVASVGHDDCAKDRRLFPPQDGLDAKSGKI